MKLLFFMIFLLAASCTSKNENSNNCMESQKRKELIVNIIDLPELQQYYEVQKVINQKPLVILKNQYIKEQFTVKKFGVPVLFLTEKEISKKQIKAYIKFRKMEIKGDYATVEFNYDIQGLGCYAKYNLKNCQWKLESKDLWEN
jgi:hypothetical protein